MRFLQASSLIDSGLEDSPSQPSTPAEATDEAVDICPLIEVGFNPFQQHHFANLKFKILQNIKKMFFSDI